MRLFVWRQKRLTDSRCTCALSRAAPTFRKVENEFERKKDKTRSKIRCRDAPPWNYARQLVQRGWTMHGGNSAPSRDYPAKDELPAALGRQTQFCSETAITGGIGWF
jgi:hypothetical protein